MITVKMSDIYVNGIDRLVQKGVYPSRSEAIRVAIRDLLMKELWVDGYPKEFEDESQNWAIRTGRVRGQNAL